MIRRTARIATVLLGVVALASCGAQGDSIVDESLDVNGAKRVAMEMELAIADLIPPEYVASIDQRQEGILLSCDGEGGFHWNGQTKVLLQGDPETTPFVEAAVAAYAESDPYSARLEETADGMPSARILGPYGAGYFMTESVDGTTMEILSFSPCFRLPDDISPRGSF